MEYLREAASPNDVHEVELRVPAGIQFQLIFRKQLATPFAVSMREDCVFVFVDSAAKCLAQMSRLRHLYGWAGAIRTLLKVVRGNRYFYAVMDGEHVLHTGWINDSFCSHYNIVPGDLVVGPIWSAPAAQGRGIGTYATQLAINFMFARGRRVFYIDTANTNIPCLKLIRHCEFGHPIASYIRD